MKILNSNKKSERGAMMVEYALTACFLCLVIVGATKHTGSKINQIFEQGGGSMTTMETPDISQGGGFAPTPIPTPHPGEGPRKF